MLSRIHNRRSIDLSLCYKSSPSGTENELAKSAPKQRVYLPEVLILSGSLLG